MALFPYEVGETWGWVTVRRRREMVMTAGLVKSCKRGSCREGGSRDPRLVVFSGVDPGHHSRAEENQNLGFPPRTRFDFVSGRARNPGGRNRLHTEREGGARPSDTSRKKSPSYHARSRRGLTPERGHPAFPPRGKRNPLPLTSSSPLSPLHLPVDRPCDLPG